MPIQVSGAPSFLAQNPKRDIRDIRGTFKQYLNTFLSSGYGKCPVVPPVLRDAPPYTETVKVRMIHTYDRDIHVYPMNPQTWRT